MCLSLTDLRWHPQLLQHLVHDDVSVVRLITDQSTKCAVKPLAGLSFVFYFSRVS